MLLRSARLNSRINKLFDGLEKAEPQPKKCAVQDKQGNHCPEPPEHNITIDGETVMVCNKCFQILKHKFDL